ncbi:DSD1 family PLP-dependent enzyme [Streptomyces sp. S3(2020)]|uniref:alanine racemase n=1 Tax=Streptomyces sp. S3(2020) TaxID=2732044 RepID=UPI001487AF48|nr:alanine racemase [Streptomyces sp. S3(2020)]NNN29701.1 DSD1 family PLP-dependent enzyme [Streptomyces sp. S3(2020)]
MTDTDTEPTLAYPHLEAVPTPYALVDRRRVAHNVRRLNKHLGGLGVSLRPHVKTTKSPELTRMIWDGGTGPITVSTLAEAEAFAADGFWDIVYAVGIAPDKLDRVHALRAGGADLVVLLDSVAQAEAVSAASRTLGDRIPALIEIDCDGHRSGVRPADPVLPRIADALRDAELRGVLAHAGESYNCRTTAELEVAAENERATTVAAAEALRAAGHRVDVVSIGSTPTAHFVRDVTGVTEVRAGNYLFFDLVMAGIGVCDLADIALSVVVTVIGHQAERGWIVTDGGWTATSRDRGTAEQAVDHGYGLVLDLSGRPIPDLLMASANQEHGILALREGSRETLPDLPVGTKVRVAPNHACATAGQYRELHVLDDPEGPLRTLARVEGW